MKKTTFAQTSAKALALTGIAAGLALAAGAANAHVGYGAALYDPALNGSLALGQTFNATPKLTTVSSNAGFLAGLNDTTYGNTHDQRFSFFTLDRTSQVTFTVSARAAGNAAGAANNLNPGFTVFNGVVPAASHDGVGDSALNAAKTGVDATKYAALSATTKAGLATTPGFASWSPFALSNPVIDQAGGGASDTLWGHYRTDQAWSTGNDPGQWGTVTWAGIAKADAASGEYADGLADGTVTGTYTLGPGTYSLVVGGANPNDYASLFTEVQKTTFVSVGGVQTISSTPAYTALRLARGATIDMSVTAVPVPAAVWLFGSALAGMGIIGRRKQAQA